MSSAPHTATATDWATLAAAARKGKRLSGFYNENFSLDVNGKPYLFRFPKPDEKQMDPRPMDEKALLSLLAHSDLPLPSLVYTDPDGTFFVEEFIKGGTLEVTNPPGSPVPETVMEAVANVYATLAALEIPDVTPLLAPDWPTRGPGLTFFEKLIEKAWIINDTYRASHGRYYDFIGLPADPYTPFLTRGAKLSPRPWRLLHADLHRGNIMHGPDGVYIIDWELALYGDLLYCVAAHLHRMRYHAKEKNTMAARIKAALPPTFQHNFDEDLTFYLDYEALKSVITDTVRFPELIQHHNLPLGDALELCVYYADNLNRLAPLLGTRKAQAEQVLEWFREWAV